MKINIPSTNKEQIRGIMRSLGYFENFDRNTGKVSYIRRLSHEGFYPRFHIYVNENPQGRLLDLHLDQKKPSYAGARAHNAEYDSDVVKREAERIQEILEGMEIVSENKPAIEKKKTGLWENIKKLLGGN